MESVDISLDPEDGAEDNQLKVDVFSSKLFEVRTIPQREVDSHLMKEASGLEPDQFVVSSWALPIIPKPQDKGYNHRVRLAPDNVNLKFFGHPIYWIDPRITKRRRGESDNYWAVRMYYVIFALGLWESPLGKPRWVSYPSTFDQVRGYTVDQFHEYHGRGAPECIFDQVKILTEEDYLVEPDEVERVIQATINELENRTSERYAQFIDDQLTALERAAQVLGVNKGTSVEDMERFPSSIWSQVLEPQVTRLMEEYGERLDRNSSISSMVRPVYEIVNDCSSLLQGIDRIITLLTIPVLGDMETNESEYARYQTLLSISLSKNDRRSNFYNFKPLVREMFDKEGSEIAVKLYQALTSYFDDSHRRLQFALINFHRRSAGKEVYSSSEEYRKDVEMRHFEDKVPVSSGTSPDTDSSPRWDLGEYGSRRERIRHERNGS